MDTPFLVRRDPVQHHLLVTIALLAFHQVDGMGADRRTVGDKLLAESLHPGVILVELLAPGDGAPGDVLVHVGVAGVVADVFVLQPRPGGRRDDLGKGSDGTCP